MILEMERNQVSIEQVEENICSVCYDCLYLFLHFLNISIFIPIEHIRFQFGVCSRVRIACYTGLHLIAFFPIF